MGIVGCGLHGVWTARALAAAGYGPGVCTDPEEERAFALARELGWAAGTREDALGAEIVACVTPGHTPVVEAGDLRPGLHLNMLGADGPGKAEATPGAVASCALFCDEWAQASHGGELTGAVEAGQVTRDQVTDLGAVLAGEAPGRPGPDAVTLFDSTGLAIQDLAVAAAAREAGAHGPRARGPDASRSRPSAAGPRLAAARHRVVWSIERRAPSAAWSPRAVGTLNWLGANVATT